jgi:hypothetical protein
LVDGNRESPLQRAFQAGSHDQSSTEIVASSLNQAAQVLCGLPLRNESFRFSTPLRADASTSQRHAIAYSPLPSRTCNS